MSTNSHAQNKGYTTIDISNGLPSNSVYRTLEDDHGFLWVATNAGLARFDGKRFQLYTKKDGLRDDEVLSIIKEKNGTIWVNCFKQSPAYFDEVQNRFIEVLGKKQIADITSTLNTYLYALEDGGVMYVNNKGCFVFRDKKLTAYPFRLKKNIQLSFLKSNKDGTNFSSGAIYDNQGKYKAFGFFQVNKNTIIDSVIVSNNQLTKFGYATYDNGKLYQFNFLLTKLYIYSNFQINPIRYHVDSIPINEKFVHLLFTKTSLYFVGESGKMYVYNKNTLKQTDLLKGDYLPNSYYDDSQGNKWVSTLDKGLALYKKKPLEVVKLPANYLGSNFISIAKTKDGTLLFGNYNGEVLETKNGKLTVHLMGKKATFKIRKILLSGNDVFTFSEEGTFYNYRNQILDPRKNVLHRSKTAITLNDSIIIVGTHYGLDELNTRTKKIRKLNPHSLRITALTKKDDKTVYFGSLNGLYKYDVVKNTYTSLGFINEALTDRIAALCYSKDNILWVSTGSNIIALKNDKVLPLINNSSISFNGQYRNIISVKNGQLWTATSNGINIFNYQLKVNKITYSTSNLTTNDGLASNDVQDLIYQDSTIYVTTSNGISVIPGNFVLPKFNIPTHLIHMRVDQRDTILAKQYNLKYNQQNVQMQFAGVDLSGHFKHFQYTLDKNTNWVNLEENTLVFQLNSGQHILQVRAVDVSGNISNHILTIKFDVAVPFWKTIWFWVIIIVTFQVFLIYYINQRQRRRKEAGLAKKLAAVQTAALEQQAFTSLMNPHFMFNALNSIQHYINVQDRQNANRYLSDFASLIRKNFEAAQHSFIPLEEEVENIKMYLNLEQMRFNDQFEYKIKIDPKLDVEDWMIPSMILQPLLENALLHGIMPSKIAGKVSIYFNLQNKDLLIILTDNGIGLINSEVLKTNAIHKSRGTELIRKRIKALNSFDSQPITIIMEPAFKSKKNPGNKISFLIPATLHQAWLKAKPQTHS